MRFLTMLFAASAVALHHSSTYGGTGPYKSYYFEESSLPNHTFYQPIQSSLTYNDQCGLKLPVVIWGNGACAPFGLKFQSFLGEIASHGALAIATGPAFVDPELYKKPNRNYTNLGSHLASLQHPEALTNAVDWVIANAGKGKWSHIDPTRIGVWGQSCGALEAYTAGGRDSRVHHLGIFNSGQFTPNASLSVIRGIEKPIFYFLGGPEDIAYNNGERDYATIYPGVPAWKGNHELGHSAAFDAPNSGIAGIAGRHLMLWLLRGDVRSRRWFMNGEAETCGFKDVVYKDLNKIISHPI